MSDKKYSLREAAVAVLAKAAEIAKTHELAKGETGHEKGVHVGYPGSKPGVSRLGDSIRVTAAAGHKDWKPIQSKNQKRMVDKVRNEASDINPKLDKDEEESGDMAMSEDAPKPESRTKGHIKLAKFVGRMDQKRGKPSQEMDKGETGAEKGVHTSMKQTSGQASPGESAAGRNVVLGGSANMATAKDAHKQVLGEMKQMPKPKLPG